MNTAKKIVACLLLSGIIFSCTQQDKKITILVKNTLDIERAFEMVELSKIQLKGNDLSHLVIRDVKTGETQVTQTVDNDGDGEMDDILFQPNIEANSEKLFEVVVDSVSDKPQSEVLCYSRFVPERTDDYAWENDKVAFRVYGPVAQKMIEDSIPGGTLSSGVDAWLKKVSYSIINKWYAGYLVDPQFYHKDIGEGLDNFHVGASRGVGGIAIKTDTTYYYSKNYINNRTITTGPLRTSFYLEYEDWDAGGKLIKESKVITLDLGSNLSKFEISIEGAEEISAGLTLHEKDGVVTGNLENGWVSYWQPHGESEIGTAILASPGTFLNFEEYNVESKDLSNAYANLKVNNNSVTYYAGFAWKESSQYPTKESWENYLNNFSKRINHPLEVVIGE